jgi:O-antigen ligase
VKTNPILADRVEYRNVVNYLMKDHRRLDRYGVTFKMVKAHPIAGVGFNNYAIVFDYYYNIWVGQHEYKISDNMYLRMLGESGIAGLALFILFIFFMLKKGIRYLKNYKEKDADIRLVFILMLAGILIHMLSYDLFYWATPFYLFLLSSGAVSGRWDHENA